MAQNGAYEATGSDQSGYLNILRQLRAGQLVEPAPKIVGLEPPAWDRYFQQPLGYRSSTETPVRVPTYPPGYPLHLFAASFFVGPAHAAIVVGLLLCLASAALMFAIGRELGLSPAASVVGAALLLACPLFLLSAVQPMSDVPATVWTLATLWCALRARRSTGFAIATGVSFAIAVLVRPSNALLVLPLAVLWGLRWRLWLAFGLGGVPGGAFQAWYNHTLYGTALTTGYGDVGYLFSARFVPHNAAHFARWITGTLSPVAVVAALAAPVLARSARRALLMLLAWAVAFIGFYVFYFHSGEFWWYLRFILPMFPAVILAAALGGEALLARWSHRTATVVGLAAVTLALGWQVTVTRQQHVFAVRTENVPYTAALDWMQAHAPKNAIALQMQLSGCFTYYTDFTTVRWDLISPEGWTALQTAAQASGRPVYATLFEFETQGCFERVPGPWRRVAELGRISIWELAR